ncbi:hypothetical protein PFICI_12276 [Pestalotiopsis fici W106-1]|uniref:FAD-binding PCMH-type domain-containing protein n=1 Tax=Pestalotiopsis fici (strain W106-1 / CGMCC3.15140) TaxID=1229662 RepID=W3WQC1_PESFW|nr:uncharacterized protein PFICI_12276 [Pestalotiopsis fici W106-1]ETS75332.1 hypothetical protein PFICI_12276 [Pestalotiopsis fici W106-1]
MGVLLRVLLWSNLAVAAKVNFPFESIQLAEADVEDFREVSFGNASVPVPNTDCRAYPGASGWPVDADWAQLNKTLEGSLLHPSPIASVCYEGPSHNSTQCNTLLRNASTSRFYIDDPLSVLTAWTEGDTCFATASPVGLNCTQGGFPEYVVNVTNVKQIQASKLRLGVDMAEMTTGPAAVNFARNKNIRLVIKNSGHDWHGRSTGFGSLSIWTHWLKDFEFLPQYEVGKYSGRAARVATGLEAWQMYQHMNENNVSIVVPGSYTIAPYGGWMAAGGHNPLASYYGLGADQVLSLQVVTADGTFVTASPDENQDLFYALRGGGGSTFGVVTSVIVKAHPFINVTRSSVDFAVRNATNSTEVETFWRGIDLYYHFGKAIVDAGGTAYGDITTYNVSLNNSFTFSTQIEMPAMTAGELFDFVQPLIGDLNAIGISINNSQPVPSTRWTSGNNGLGDVPGNSRFASRLFPRSNFEDDETFKATTSAIRKTVEAGYRFHGIHMQPTESIAGLPGNSSVNPAFRTTIMHADLFDNAALRGVTPEEWFSSYQRFNVSMSKLRDVTPGSGAYFNEADVEEPHWQQAFFGSNYPTLLDIKKNRDPWNLFYAADTVGSENWKVITSDGLPTQNGPLCKVSA